MVAFILSDERYIVATIMLIAFIFAVVFAWAVTSLISYITAEIWAWRKAKIAKKRRARARARRRAAYERYDRHAAA